MTEQTPNRLETLERHKFNNTSLGKVTTQLWSKSAHISNTEVAYLNWINYEFWTEKENNKFE